MLKGIFSESAQEAVTEHAKGFAAWPGNIAYGLYVNRALETFPNFVMAMAVSPQGVYGLAYAGAVMATMVDKAPEDYVRPQPPANPLSGPAFQLMA